MGILFDEINIKSGLVYSKQTGTIVGFCDMADMNNELEDFKNQIENKEEDKPTSTYVLTFMVRGVFTSFGPGRFHGNRGNFAFPLKLNICSRFVSSVWKSERQSDN